MEPRTGPVSIIEVRVIHGYLLCKVKLMRNAVHLLVL